MQAIEARNVLFKKLQRMMDRLSSPDLTVAEANVLRPRLLELISLLRELERRDLLVNGTDCGTAGFRGEPALALGTEVSTPIGTRL